MVTLAIFGGTFDPIHNGHLSVATAVQSVLKPERMVFVPAGNPPHKQKHHITGAEHRWNMVSLAVKEGVGWTVSRVDIDRQGPHYSVDMVQILRREFAAGAKDTYFIIGADSLADILSWHKPQELVDQCRLVAVHRPGVQPAIERLVSAIPQLSVRLTWVEMPPVPISATEIRQRVARGESVSGMVPPVVAKYIARNGLYSPNATSES